MMLLAGVLMVLGFVTIGATLVQLESLETTTARLQRDSTVQDFRTVVADVNASIAAKVRLGEKDVDKFVQDSDDLAQTVKRVATRKGFYLDIQLAEKPSSSIYAKESRCPTFDSDEQAAIDRGVIVAYDRASNLKTIVGAVYDIYLTNGHESLKYRYYVQMFPCILKDTYNYFHRTTGIEGLVSGEDNATAPDGGVAAEDDADGDQAMTLEEATSVAPPAIEQLEPESVSPQWGADSANVFDSDDVYAEDSQPNNVLKVSQMDTTGLPEQGIITSNVYVHLEQHVTLATGEFEVYIARGTNDNCELGPLVSGGRKFGTLLVDVSLIWEFPLNVTGEPWQLADLADLEVCVQSRKAVGPNPSYRIDHIFVNATILPTPAQSGEYEIEWDFIPYDLGDPFQSHELQLRYRSPVETWTVEVWDEAAKVWNVRGTLSPTSTFTPWTYVLTTGEMTGGYPTVRFTDSIEYASEPTELELDYVRILSQV